MQELLAGAAIGSIITLLIMVVWHKAAVASLRELLADYRKQYKEDGKWIRTRTARLDRIIAQFQNGKSGTAKLAVKIARGEVV